MPKLGEIDNVHINIAKQYSKFSKGVRAKVGAILVTKTGVIIPGYNGTHSGADNNLEYTLADGTLQTKSTVLHAELNCILKAAKEGVPISGSTLYTTLSPCERCAPMLAQAEVQRVVYAEEYKDTTGLEILRDAGVVVEKYSYYIKRHKRDTIDDLVI
jgi:dCMP deaminase